VPQFTLGGWPSKRMTDRHICHHFKILYPESLKEQLMDSLVAKGVQRFVSLGKSPFALPGLPQDALELMRRACKWIVDEINPE